MNCINKDIGELFDEYLFDFLDEEQKAKFEIHLLQCNYCSKKLEKYSEIGKYFHKNKGTVQEIIQMVLEKQKTRLPDQVMSDIKPEIHKTYWLLRPSTISGVAAVILLTFFILLDPLEILKDSGHPFKPDSTLTINHDTIDKQVITEKPDSAIATTKPDTAAKKVKEPDQNDFSSLASFEYDLRIVEVSRRSPNTTMEKALDLFNKANNIQSWGKAENAFLKIILNNKNKLIVNKAKIYRGICLIELGRFDDETLNLFTESVDSVTSQLKKEGYWILANLYLKRNQPLKAIEILNKYTGEDKFSELINKINVIRQK